MNRRNLLRGGLLGTAAAVVSRVAPSEKVKWAEERTPAGVTYRVGSESGYAIQQRLIRDGKMPNPYHEFPEDETILAKFRATDWYQNMLQQRVIEMLIDDDPSLAEKIYPPTELHRPDGTIEYTEHPALRAMRREKGLREMTVYDL